MKKYFTYALWLSLFTIIANLVEGSVSTYFGYQDETLALFGFGIDSFIEVISAVGITWMILRIQKQPESERSPLEVTALRITGTSFYLLTAGLLITVILEFDPETPTGIHHLGHHHLAHFNQRDGISGMDEDQSRESTRFRCHSGGCELHQSVHLYVNSIAGFQPDLLPHPDSILRQPGRARDCLLLVH